MATIKTYRDLDVYRNAMELAMRIFHLTKDFPPEERYSLTDQIRRSSRSVCANIAEAWRKRRYEAAFVSKLSDSEAEPPKRRCTLKLPTGPATGNRRPSPNSMTPMTRSWANSSK